MDKVEDIVGQLRAVATSKESLDFSHGRKAPLYGKETEIEWQAADLIQSQQALIEEMMAQIGDDAVSIDGEWGAGRGRSEIEADGDMPDCYYRAKALSQKDQIDG